MIMKKKKYFFIFLILLYFPSMVFAKTLLFSDKDDEIYLAPYTYSLEDKTKKITIDDALISKEFIPFTKKSYGFGYTGSAIWIKFSVLNKSAVEKYLEIPQPHTDNIKFFEIENNRVKNMIEVGDRFIFSKRPILHRNFIFKIEPSNDVITYFIRFESTTYLTFPIILWSKQALDKHDNFEISFTWMFIGIMMSMAIYNLLVFISVREKDYLYYVLLNIGYGVHVFCCKALGFQILWPNYPTWHNISAPTLLVFIAIMMLQFSKHFLNLKKNSPILNHVTNIVVALISISILVNLIFMTSRFNGVSLLLYIITLTITAVYALIKAIKGNREAFLFFISWIFAFINFLSFPLYVNGTLIDLPMSKWFFQIGGIFQTIFLSFGLSDKINTMKKRVEGINESLRELDKLKDQFLANTSHELRTPLNGINGLAESLIEGACGPLNKDVTKNLQMIVMSSKRLNSLVNDILDYSSIKNKSLTIHGKPVDIRQIVELVIAISRPLMGSKNLIISNKISEAIPFIHGDEIRIQQIMQNLIGNSIKFTDSGEITIYAANIINIKNNKRMVKITVKDTGIGIPAEKQKTIFKPFEQADGSIERIYGGTGLGLAVTKNLVELHCGEIWVESDLGKGASFIFTLPVSDEPALPAQQKNKDIYNEKTLSELSSSIEEEAISLNKRNIKALVIDDEPVNLQVVKNHLSISGINVETALSGFEALDKLNYIQPDIVLLDIMMPKLNGYETAKRIREKFNREELPIIFLTAKNQVNDLIVGFSSGGNDYITKPFSKNELITRMSFHIELSMSRKALKSANEQIKYLLEATKDISTAKHKVSACSIALNYLLAIDKDVKLETTILYLPQKTGTSFNAYEIWTKGKSFEDPIPFEISYIRAKSLKETNRMLKNDDTIIIPIKAGEREFGLLELINYTPVSAFDKTLPQLEGIVRSLAMTLESFEAEENRRLAGIGTMAASVIHDLKNPLGAIMGYAEMADDDNLGKEMRQEFLRVIIDEASHMAEMAQEVLEFSRAELNINIEEVDPDRYFSDLARTLKPIFTDNDFTFEYKVNYHEYIAFDPSRIRRVIYNLATNARDAMLGGKTKNGMFLLTLDKGKQGLVIEAKDNGPGIPRHIHATIFEPFITYGKSQGTGLGMAIVKRIIEAHGGKILFETIQDSGTKFTILLPLIPISKSNYKVFSQKNKIKILIVDDSVVNQKLLLYLLKKIEHTADVVKSGKEAISALEASNYDVVLMDIQMPGMDGFEATRLIRSPDSKVLNKNILIIAITGHDTDEIKEKCIESGMNAHVSKPINIEKLKKVL
ncbi:MAG: response regulator [Desulfobacterales bacterium]|nr:response regulator [Desulfobacterales bacterium]MBF0397127.1 response regulator [Desulfobacterales bacterium]